MSNSTYRALVIANSTFPSDPHNLRDLEGPRNDPALLRDALCDDRYGLFPSDNVRLVTERTMAEVMEEAEDFLRSAHRHNRLLLYYSGHGRLDLSNELHLCARNSRTDRLLSSAIRASDLNTMIDDSAAATTIVILDCCHSGAFKGGSLAEKLTGRGRFVITSCRTGDLANDSHAPNRASMFTHHLVRGMLGEATDQDNDGFVDLDDIYDYVHRRLTTESRQIPERSFAGSGNVPIAHRPQQAETPRSPTNEGGDQDDTETSRSNAAGDGIRAEGQVFVPWPPLFTDPLTPPRPQPHPKTRVIFGLGLAGWLLLPLLLLIPCIPAWIMGRRARREIRRNPAAYSRRGLVTAGWILGLLGTCYLIALIAALIVSNIAATV